MLNQGYRPATIPDWLKRSEGIRIPSSKDSEGFIDKTLRQVITIIEDTTFNERTAKKKGLLQLINPKLKILTILSFIVLISLQKALPGIILFLILGVSLLFLSRISPLFVLKRILPLVFLTILVALPASLNIIIEGRELMILHEYESPLKVLWITIPQRIAITEEGLVSMLTLVMRVSCSLLFVFLLTMTTRPDRFIKSLTYLTPNFFSSLIGVTYRYVFFLIRRMEEFLKGLESRRISRIGSSEGRRWVASRIGLLFLISLELSRELSLTMKSRGYRDESSLKHIENRLWSFRKIDTLWLILSLIINGLVVWMSLM